jgi:hypothetical protein
MDRDRTPPLVVVPEVHVFLLFYFVVSNERGQTNGFVPVITFRRIWRGIGTSLVSQQPMFGLVFVVVGKGCL